MSGPPTVSPSSLSTSSRLLMQAALLACLAGLCLAVLGSLVDDRSAAYGALAGAAITTVVLFGGSVVVDLVAGLMPAASLLVALLTYALQLLLLGMGFLAVQESAELRAALDRAWIGFAVIAVTATWLTAQIVLDARRRIPVFEASEGDHP